MISGVVLAAGTASRFGSTKQLAVLDGAPLVLHAVGTLRDRTDEIVVVTGHDADAVEAVLPEDVRPVRNARYRDGMATSLAAALHALDDDSEAAVILQADQPGVRGDDVDALIDRFRVTRARIVRLRYADGPGPSLLSREIYADAGHLSGDAGARILIASHPEWVEEVERDRAAPLDVDREADLERAARERSAAP
ncbi:MAG TPA: nucleotidyltransferase family protein [Actinomycetota bacterium]|nr:nucleotidyltransferase family protein [Actinomycetota bacterium]